MRYGVCIGLDNCDKVRIAADSGFDYIECGFGTLARCSDEEFELYKKVLDEKNIRVEAANGFLPGELKVCGENVDSEALCAYIEKGMQRGHQIGLKTVVFGSGGARSLPDGWDYRDGFLQLAEFLRDIAGPIAAKYGIRIVMEPLRRKECNIINTVKEGVMLAACSERENVGGLADLFHMVEEGDTNEDIKDLKGSLWHAHISNPVKRENANRIYPLGENEFDYKSFIEALEYSGCERCSIEAACFDFEKEAPVAAQLLKRI